MERKYKQENGNYLQENINMFKVTRAGMILWYLMQLDTRTYWAMQRKAKYLTPNRRKLPETASLH